MLPLILLSFHASIALSADVDMTAIDTHVSDLDTELVDFFKADKFPTASFKARGLSAAVTRARPGGSQL